MKNLHFSIIVTLLVTAFFGLHYVFAQNVTNSTYSMPPNAIRTPNGGWITPPQTTDQNGKNLTIHYETGIPVSGSVMPPGPPPNIQMNYSNYTSPALHTQQELSPLKQFKLGVEATDVICQPFLTLVIKSENNFPACVKPESVTRLTKQGWIESSYNGSGNIQTQFLSKLISQEKAIQIAQEYVKEPNRIKIFNYSNSEIQANLVYYITMSFPRVSVDYNTGIPTQVMDWLDGYYKNPHWWTELEKDYLGLPSHRVEGGHIVWERLWKK